VPDVLAIGVEAVTEVGLGNLFDRSVDEVLIDESNEEEAVLLLQELPQAALLLDISKRLHGKIVQDGCPLSFIMRRFCLYYLLDSPKANPL